MTAFSLFWLALAIAAIIYSIVLHEIAHGWMALRMGDDTAKLDGRLTLNPLPHLDIFGSMVLPIALLLIGFPIFGWAKPVPINSSQFKRFRLGCFLVSMAGPVTNFAIAAIFCLLIKFIKSTDFLANQNLIVFMYAITFLNFFLGMFNLIPVPPLDGFNVLLSVLPERFHKKIMSWPYIIRPLPILLLFSLMLILLAYTDIIYSVATLISKLIYFLA